MNMRIEQFRRDREEGQQKLMAVDHLGVKRFLALDAGAYRDHSAEGGLDSKTLELCGLVASMVLRCDDCINYHLQQSVRDGWTKAQIVDAMNVGLVVLDELIAEQENPDIEG
jgi:AhpD family alkylhydroperoxidase